MPYTVNIPKMEIYDEKNNEFIYIKPTSFQVEHSLVSLQKWEQKWHKPFLVKQPEKTAEEMLDYIRCMTITQNVDPNVYFYLPKTEIDNISKYIDDPMTATWFNEAGDEKSGIKKNEVITAEIIYYWMIALNIPTEYRKWHLNTLITLIKVINIKNDTESDKKKPNTEFIRQRAAMNAARKAKMHSKG